MKTALVIGGGPAGLMAAQVLLGADVAVQLADAMPTLGRKFLMAGKSGLNVTKDEPLEDFMTAYDPLPPRLRAALEGFGPEDAKDWMAGLGQEIFTGSTGRVFPKAMKASPTLRAWRSQIEVEVLTRYKWMGWGAKGARFDTPEGEREIIADVTILALGGASWARLGSDGTWADHFDDQVVAFAPSNVGFIVQWTDHMTHHFGTPIKGTKLTCGTLESRGEWVISERGIEGGGIYTISRAARDGAAITVDLKPDWTVERIREALTSGGKQSLSNLLRKRLKLDSAKVALLSEFGRPFPDDLAPLIKALPINQLGPRPMDEGISTAGGLRFDTLTDDFMLRDRPGVFCAGEMLDWDAPTGGYLITACLATGMAAAKGALAYLNG